MDPFSVLKLSRDCRKSVRTAIRSEYSGIVEVDHRIKQGIRWTEI